MRARQPRDRLDRARRRGRSPGHGTEAVECILGRDWTVDAARPWIGTLIERFGPDRCMLGGHLPISRLSRGFAPLYDAYEALLGELSPDERDRVFRGTATAWFGLDRLGIP